MESYVGSLRLNEIFSGLFRTVVRSERILNRQVYDVCAGNTRRAVAIFSTSPSRGKSNQAVRPRFRRLFAVLGLSYSFMQDSGGVSAKSASRVGRPSFEQVNGIAPQIEEPG